MKKFKIILETEDSGKIVFSGIPEKHNDIIDDAIEALQSYKNKFKLGAINAGPSDELREALLPVCERLSKK